MSPPPLVRIIIVYKFDQTKSLFYRGKTNWLACYQNQTLSLQEHLRKGRWMESRLTHMLCIHAKKYIDTDTKKLRLMLKKDPSQHLFHNYLRFLRIMLCGIHMATSQNIYYKYAFSSGERFSSGLLHPDLTRPSSPRYFI